MLNRRKYERFAVAMTCDVTHDFDVFVGETVDISMNGSKISIWDDRSVSILLVGESCQIHFKTDWGEVLLDADILRIVDSKFFQISSRFHTVDKQSEMLLLRMIRKLHRG